MAGGIDALVLLLTAVASVCAGIALWSPHCRWPAGIGVGMGTVLGATVLLGAVGYESPLDGGWHVSRAHPVTFGASLSCREMPGPVAPGHPAQSAAHSENAPRELNGRTIDRCR